MSIVPRYTACTRRRLDKIPTEGAQLHCLALLKSLLSFSHIARGSPQRTNRHCVFAVAQARALLHAAHLVKLDAALVELIAENPDSAFHDPAGAARDRCAARRNNGGNLPRGALGPSMTFSHAGPAGNNGRSPPQSNSHAARPGLRSIAASGPARMCLTFKPQGPASARRVRAEKAAQSARNCRPLRRAGSFR